MPYKPKKKCVIKFNGNELTGEIANEYEEIGGPDDVAIFATINLDNGQIITVKMSDTSEE